MAGGGQGGSGLMGLGNTVSGGQLSMPANMLPSISAPGQLQALLQLMQQRAWRG